MLVDVVVGAIGVAALVGLVVLLRRRRLRRLRFVRDEVVVMAEAIRAGESPPAVVAARNASNALAIEDVGLLSLDKAAEELVPSRSGGAEDDLDGRMTTVRGIAAPAALAGMEQLLLRLPDLPAPVLHELASDGAQALSNLGEYLTSPAFSEYAMQIAVKAAAAGPGVAVDLANAVAALLGRHGAEALTEFGKAGGEYAAEAIKAVIENPPHDALLSAAAAHLEHGLTLGASSMVEMASVKFPVATLIFSIHRESKLLNKQKTDTATAIEHITIDVVGTAGGAALGAGIGSLFGPPGMILGGIVGGISGRLFAEKVKEEELDAAKARLRAELADVEAEWRPMRVELGKVIDVQATETRRAYLNARPEAPTLQRRSRRRIAAAAQRLRRRTDRYVAAVATVAAQARALHAREDARVPLPPRFIDDVEAVEAAVARSRAVLDESRRGIVDGQALPALPQLAGIPLAAAAHGRTGRAYRGACARTTVRTVRLIRRQRTRAAGWTRDTRKAFTRQQKRFFHAISPSVTTYQAGQKRLEARLEAAQAAVRREQERLGRTPA
jgi:hypothetical protein